MAGPRRVTLKDVAAHAGVSQTTASYILNGLSEQMRIAPETEQRVQEAIDELAYRPNMNARSLRTQRTRTIGLITDFVAGGAYSSQMLAGANLAARSADHLLVIGETEGDPRARDLLIDEMRDRQVDGIVYATEAAVAMALPSSLTGLSVATLNCYDPASTTSAVMADDREGGRLAAELLIGSGLDSGVWVVGDAPQGNVVAGLWRLAGIQSAFEAQGRSIAGEIDCSWDDPEPAYDAICSWLAEGHMARAFICMNDRVSLGAYRALTEHGLSIPGDVSIVSFDGSELASWLRPQVTSMSLPLREMGERAVRIVLGDEVPDAPLTLVPLTVQAGHSVAPRAGASGA